MGQTSHEGENTKTRQPPPTRRERARAERLLERKLMRAPTESPWRDPPPDPGVLEDSFFNNPPPPPDDPFQEN